MEKKIQKRIQQVSFSFILILFITRSNIFVQAQEKWMKTDLAPTPAEKPFSPYGSTPELSSASIQAPPPAYTAAGKLEV